MSARTLVTGIGVAAPSGLGVEDFWAATRIGKNAIGPVTRFDASSYPSRLAGEIHGFEPAEHLPGRLVPQTDRVTQLALVATDCAFEDAGLDPGDLHPCDMGVVTAAGSGGSEFGENELRKLWSQGPKHVSAYQSFAWFYAVNTGQIAVRNDLRGPTGVLVGDQAGGLDALAQARRRLRKGSRLIAAGGFDASICSLGWAAHLAAGDLSVSEVPERAYLPFDAAASGYVPGEGGALIILEDEEGAVARGARDAYAEFAGYGATLDPRPGLSLIHNPACGGPSWRRSPTPAAIRPRSTWSSPTGRACRGSTGRRPKPSPRSSDRSACRSPRPRRRPGGSARAERPSTWSRRSSPCGRG